MNTFNVQPRPRVLFESIPVALLEELRELVPTCKVVERDEAVHETEYDLLVTFSENAGRRDDRLHVLSFGAKVSDRVATAATYVALRRSFPTHAQELTIPQSASTALANLLVSSVVPHIKEGPKSTWHLGTTNPYSHGWVTDDLNGVCEPLLHVGAENHVYAFQRRRGRDGSGGVSLTLPPETTGHSRWLRTFLEIVAEVDPASVPPSIAWKSSDTWATPRLRKVVVAVSVLSGERERTLAHFQSREDALDVDMASALTEAENGAQRLLTADGDELTAAVMQAFEELGFHVQDMDGYHDARTGAKLEDLRVSDPTTPEWHCLAEVKGYQRGAKVNDVAQIVGRPAVAFTKETGEEPSAVWHIVNPWRHTDPSTRPIAIPNDAIDLRPLTDAEGALIDTRDLYRAWRDVQDNKVGADSVRKSLRSAHTRWTYDSWVELDGPTHDPSNGLGRDTSNEPDGHSPSGADDPT